jgi:hypothetical protein
MKMVKIIVDEFIKTADKLNIAYDISSATGKAFMRNKYMEQFAEIIKIMNKVSDMELDWEYDSVEKHIVFEYRRSEKDESGKAFAFTSQAEVVAVEFSCRIKAE